MRSRLFLAVLVGGVLLLFGVRTGYTQTTCQKLLSLDEGELIFCPKVADTPTPEPTKNVPPTETPEPTAVPLPTLTPTPTFVFDEGVAATWKMCEHDPKAWHPKIDTEKKCRYDHIHGDDPNSKQALEWFKYPVTKYLSQTISYPHQTLKVMDGMVHTENELKHEGYIWLVRELAQRDATGKWVEINNDLNWAGRTPNGIRYVRLEQHRHPTLDTLVQKHSYFIETYECRLTPDGKGLDLSACGWSRGGGIAHFGILHCKYKEIYCELAGDETVVSNQWIPGVTPDTSGKTIDPYRADNRVCSNSEGTGILDMLKRLPDGWNVSPVKYADNNRDPWGLWSTGWSVYGKSQGQQGYNYLFQFTTLVPDEVFCFDLNAYRNAQSLEDATSLLEKSMCANSPNPERCQFDASSHAIFTIGVYTPPTWDGDPKIDLDGKKDGFVTVNGFTDTRGNLSDCKVAGENCIMLQKDHAPIGWSGWNTAVGTYKNGKMPGNLVEYNDPQSNFWVPLIH